MRLYPLFRLVLIIVFTAVIGAQLLVVLLSLIVTNEVAVLQDDLWGILESLPFALGSVVLVFWVLQRQDVQVDWEERFDPHALPPASQESIKVSRGERIFSILFGVIFLVILARFAQQGGFAWQDGSGFFENPVMVRYFPWIALSMVIGIGLEIVLLWQGHWRLSTRIADILSNLFGLIVLGLLVRGHNAWLAAAGLPGFPEGLSEIPRLLPVDPQLAGMIVFHFGLSVAAIAVGVQTLVSLYRLLRSRVHTASPPPVEWE